MPDMSVKGSSASYSPTYFQSLTKSNNKNGEIANNQKDQSALGVKDDSAVNRGEKKAELSDDDQTTIQRMKAIENQVIAHEQAHKSAGGSLAGSASYSYTTGPDGKRYISGGEVSISTPATDDKERKVKLLDRVKQAALAPAQPSPQDIRVAAGATSEQLQLNAAIQRERGIKAYGGDKSEQQNPKGTGPKEGQYFDQVG